MSEIDERVDGEGPVVDLDDADAPSDVVVVDDDALAVSDDEVDTGLEAGAAPAALAAPGLAERIVGRLLRRPVAWWNRPWDNDRIVRLVVTSTSLTVTTLVMMWIVHFNPLSPGDDLIFDQTTPTGGDMGAHVWAPAFLRDHFLPNFQLSGWTMDWYGGLPLYRFYMVVPALAIVVLDAIPFVSYGVAFKLVAASGLMLFPIACWSFGRLAGFRHPIPELFSFGALCFLLDESFNIYGGNVLSTMAGEYSFSIALTLAMFGLGTLAAGMRTGKYRVRTAILLSLAAISHGIVLIFVAVAATIICLVWVDKTRARYAITAGVTTVLLSAWWVGPFLLGHEFMTDMKYGFRPNGPTDSFWDMYFPLTPALDIIITTLAVIGFAAMVMRRNLNGTALGLICVVFAVLVWNTRDSLPVIGLLWNPRLLPFFYLARYLLMVIGALEVLTWVINAARAKLANSELSAREGAVAYGIVAVSLLGVFAFMYEVLPGGGRVIDGEASVYAWGPIQKTTTATRAVADGWTRYNWEGYEGRPSYPAYHDLVTTMDDIGAERGCGRAMWENNSANGEFGTTMALMLLPHWTDGCIGSMEGLFFEATASTNYHFISVAALSESSSNPVRQLRYTNLDGDLAVQHLRDLGVRYAMVRTDAARTEAANTDGLEFITTSGTFDIYEVTGSRVIEPLTVAPVVVTHVEGAGTPERWNPGDERERNLELGTSWFQRRTDWPAMPVDDGPPEWQRVEATIIETERVEPFDSDRRRVDYVGPTEPIVLRQLPEVTVSDVEIEQQSLSFSVDEVGVPVLVRVSYFPNWHVEGADGPYRAGANHMVVVPTETTVSMTYDSRSSLDWFFYLLTLVGIGLCVLWRRQGDIVHASTEPGSTIFGVDPHDGADSGPDAGLDAGDQGGHEGAPGWEPDDFGAADTDAEQDVHDLVTENTNDRDRPVTDDR